MYVSLIFFTVLSHGRKILRFLAQSNKNLRFFLQAVNFKSEAGWSIVINGHGLIMTS